MKKKMRMSSFSKTLKIIFAKWSQSFDIFWNKFVQTFGKLDPFIFAPNFPTGQKFTNLQGER
jgi:hypothetical protein